MFPVTDDPVELGSFGISAQRKKEDVELVVWFCSCELFLGSLLQFVRFS